MCDLDDAIDVPYKLSFLVNENGYKGEGSSLSLWLSHVVDFGAISGTFLVSGLHIRQNDGDRKEKKGDTVPLTR